MTETRMISSQADVLTLRIDLRKLCSVLAYALSAPVVALPALTLITFTLLPPRLDTVAWYGVAVAFLSALPLLGWVVPEILRARGKVSGRVPRLASFAATLICYPAGTAILWLGGAPNILVALGLCYALSAAGLALINAFYRASGHASGVAGPATALVILYGLAGALSLLLIPLVSWARMRDRSHTLMQTVTGAAVTIAVTVLVFRAFGYLG